MGAAVNNRFLFGDFELDLDRRLLTRYGEQVALNPKAFDLLLALIESRGEVVSKNDLLDRVWENQFVEENNLTVHIAALRKALGERRGEHRYIVTVPGRGYCFIPELQPSTSNGFVIEDRSYERIIIDERIETVEDKVTRTAVTRRYAVPLLMLALAALFAIGGYFVWQRLATRPNPSLSTPDVKRLTNHGTANTAILSYDGKLFAYSQTEAGTSRTALRVGRTEGESDLVLIPMTERSHHPIAFSANAEWLYYFESKPRDFENGSLFKVPSLGGVAEKVNGSVNLSVAISPDEKQIAFIRNKRSDKKSVLVVADIDGSNEREMIVRSGEHALERYSLAWSSNSRMIAFGAGVGERGAYTSSTGEGNTSEIFAFNIDSRTVVQVTDLNWNSIAKLAWIDNDSAILVVGRDRESFAAAQIYRVQFPTGKTTKVVDDLAHYGSVLSVSSDSRSAVVAQINRDSAVWVAPVNEFARAEQLTSGGLFRQDGWYGLDWHPDGRLVYSARVDHSLPLWIMNSDGSDQRQLTPLGAQDRTPSVSPDGQFVTFESNRSGRAEIWRVGADGKDLTQLTTDGGNSNPGVTPDSHWIIYRHVDEEASEIRRVSVNGGPYEVVSSKDCISARLSKTGDLIACGRSLGGKMRLAVVSIVNGEAVKEFDLPAGYNFDMAALRWSPNGKFIDYRDWFNGVWRQPIEGGEPKKLEGLPSEKLLQFAWSQDGQQAAFTRGRSLRDIVLLKFPTN